MTKLTIGLGKVAGSIEVDRAKLEKHSQVMEYIFMYGLKQMLNDVHASEKEGDKKLALSQKKLDSLYAGEVAQQRSGGDPVAREMRAMAEADLKAKLKAIGKKVADYEKPVWSQVVEKQLKANEAAYRKAAEAKLAIKPEQVTIDDIDELFADLAESPEGEPETPEGEETGETTEE